MAACGAECGGCGGYDTTGVLTYVGAGGEYVQQTSYKYVGRGAGNFDVVPVPTNFKSNWCWCIIPLVLLSLLLLLFLAKLSSAAPTPPPTMQPLGPPRDCRVYGDPHVLTFDGKHADYYTPGEYWIIKSDVLTIQGKYGPTPMTNGLAVTKGIAISGSVINNHKLIIMTMDMGGAAFTWDGQPILVGFPSTYSDPEGLVHADYNNIGDTMQKGRTDKPLHVMHIALPNGLTIQVNQWNEPGEGAYLNAKISMPQGYAVIDGHCGNFNGNPEDDARLMVRARVGTQGVDPADLLFPGGKTPINPTNRPDINNCEQGKLDRAKESCKKSEGKWNPSMQCLIDVCFGGAGFAGEEGA